MLNIGRLAQEMLRILYCSSESRFKEIFGDAGADLWFIYREKYSGNQGRFLVEITGSQAEQLANHARKTIPEFSPGGDIGYVIGADE